MSKAAKPTALDTSRGGFQSFESAASRGPLACAFNSSGDQIVIAFPDHRLRVYRELSNTSRILLDQWRAHDGEIFDASQYNPRNFRNRAKRMLPRFNG